MEIWIISAFDPTPLDGTRPMRFMGIADAAVSRGHRVTYFSNTFRHSTRQERYAETTHVDYRENYRLVFVKSPPYGGNLSAGRLRSHWVYGRNLVGEVNKLLRPDIVFISLPPLSSAEAIARWARTKRIPVVVDIIDPWPDALYFRERGLRRGLFRAAAVPLSLKLRRILKHASAVSAISQAYVDWAKDHAGRDLPGACFYPSVNFAGIQQQLADAAASGTKRNGVLHLVYAGSLASSYDMGTIIRAAEILESQHPGKTLFSIAGSGAQEPEVTRAAEKMANLRFMGRLGQKELMELFAEAHLGLIQHTSRATQTVTYKVFDYLGAGLPILNSLQSEVTQIIDENQVGFNHAPGDAEQLARLAGQFLEDPDLLAACSANALELTARKGDSPVVYGELVRYLETIQETHVPEVSETDH